MQDLSLVIAANLKRIREEKKLSLDKASELTKVSKSMLGQIERGESNPTINTIWRIASGLKVSFTSLIHLPQADAVIVRRAEVEPLIEDGGRYRVYPVFPYEDGRRFELYLVEIDQGGCYHSTHPHVDGSKEFITVMAGELTLLTNGQTYTLQQGDSICFRADKPHAYKNTGRELIRLSMAIDYPATVAAG
ncbi:helix-turn-helix transcriptional regulator|uniref:Transcriptional regulator, XRE family with cupin sensor n=1 Tax=Dendrosporobacter quercicolus TaxID=146817 RepID=A0A1G9VQ66_9FIRM|nr:XRE family transcriptional regulator [Dendrosporobacter quercicolus]NSL47832.1 helix-turn-helix transcriptional regulator [Dendrosporobacter quercicolus DSM 1736]SDM74362.1 transcriptional regulator, XRE family with cupin sensor [Dendrosporobacter quercicolus]